MTDIKQLLSTNVYQALINANAPTAVNPYATKADVTAASIPISKLLAATANNTIDNTNKNQTWQWTITGGGQIGLHVTENVAGSAASSYLFAVDTIAGSTVKPFRVQVTAQTVLDFSNVGAVTLGNTTLNTPVTINTGTGNFSVVSTSSSASGMDFGSGTFTGSINLGITTGANTETINIGTTGGNTTVHNINIGTTGGGAIILGNNNTNANSISLFCGSGGISMVSVAAGFITIGGAGQTATITLGSSTATNTVIVAGGTGAGTVQIANQQAAGSVSIGTNMGTGTITMGGVAQTGTITLGQSTSAQILNLGIGVAGTNKMTINIGTGLTTHSASSINIGNQVSTSTVAINITSGSQGLVLDGTVNTGALTSSSITIGASINSLSSTGGNITIGGAATGANAIADDIRIGSSGASTGTINIGRTTGAGAQTVSIGVGSGTNTITIGNAGSTTFSVKVGNGHALTGGNDLIIDGVATSVMTIGGVTITSGTLNLGTGITSGTINIGTAVTSGALKIGNTAAGSTITLQGGTSVTGVTGVVNVTSTNLTINHLVGNTATPTNTPGTGAGTGPTVTNAGTDIAGTITVLTGTLPTAAANIVTINFAKAFGGGSPYVVLVPGNAAAAGLTGVTNAYISSTANANFVLKAGPTGLVAATTYIWYYHVIQ